MPALLIFVSTLLLSASLLFSIQPIFTKMVLPLLGGSPAVWNTSMLFYQSVLLMGYLYAHLSARWLGARRQALLHAVILLTALLTLPVALPHGVSYSTTQSPVLWLLITLLMNVGLPVFVVSSTAPMLQGWFTHTSHRSSNDPYFLYAASNAGSMGALLAYPTLIEPWLTLHAQSILWSAGYAGLAVLIPLCAFNALRSKKNPESKDILTQTEHDQTEQRDNGKKTTNRLRIYWVVLAFVPSSLLLGVTNHISTDIASVPLLWVIPLAIYLFTFTITFARRPIISNRLAIRVQPVFILALASVFVLEASFGIWTKIAIHLLTFFITALVCHGLLAEKRPRAEELTSFYIWLSVGGILGGAFNALIAPVIFNSIIEYPLIIILSCLLRAQVTTSAPDRKNYLYDITLPLILFLILTVTQPYLKGFVTIGSGGHINLLLSVIIIIIGYILSKRRLRFTLTVGAIILAGAMFWQQGDARLIYRERSFFGVQSVTLSRLGHFNILRHGNTTHGAQFLNETLRSEPLTYYNPGSPIAELLNGSTTNSTLRRVALVGLGAGSLASYARTGEHWTYYEIDPVVAKIASDPKYFSFLKDSKGKIDIILGDARLQLQKAPDKKFDIIILDAFSSDSIPVHLVTLEALKLYISKLADNGIIAFHTSNQFLEITPMLSSLARIEGLFALSKTNYPNERERRYRYWTPSQWTVMAKDISDLAFLATNAGNKQGWLILQGDEGVRAWTDDFSNILSILK